MEYANARAGAGYPLHERHLLANLFNELRWLRSAEKLNWQGGRALRGRQDRRPLEVYTNATVLVGVRTVMPVWSAPITSEADETSSVPQICHSRAD